MASENKPAADSPLNDRLSPAELESLRREATETRSAFRAMLAEEVVRAVLMAAPAYRRIADRHPTAVLWPDYAVWVAGETYFWVLSGPDGESADWLLYLRVRDGRAEQLVQCVWGPAE